MVLTWLDLLRVLLSTATELQSTVLSGGYVEYLMLYLVVSIQDAFPPVSMIISDCTYSKATSQNGQLPCCV